MEAVSIARISALTFAGKLRQELQRRLMGLSWMPIPDYLSAAHTTWDIDEDMNFGEKRPKPNQIV